jgi:hypothetical protein
MSEGTTAKFGTGAIRSDAVESFRYDLVSPIGLREIARACAEGAEKYGDWNWEKGMPVHDLLNHAIAHIYQFLSGDRREPHLGHAAWNVLAAIHSDELWPHLNEGSLRGPGCVPPLQEKQSCQSSSRLPPTTSCESSIEHVDFRERGPAPAARSQPT